MKCGAIAVSVALFLIGAGTVPSRVLAQGVEARSHLPAGAVTSKLSATAYIEIRSVMPDHQQPATHEEAGAPRPGARENTAPVNKEKVAWKKPQPVVSYGLKNSDYGRIMETIPGIREAVPIREIPKPIRYQNQTIDGRILGTTDSYANVNHLEMARGRFLTGNDHAKYQNSGLSDCKSNGVN